MDKIVEKITKLITLTQNNTIKWRAYPPEGERIILDDDSYALGAVYRAQYKDKHLRIYKRRFKVNEPTNPYVSSLTNNLLGYSKINYPYWDTKVVLEFISIDGDSLWVFPPAPSLEDLFSAVQYQVADVGNFLNDI